jgi:RNA polymerase sigma-70 factor (ECF subfamily)
VTPTLDPDYELATRFRSGERDAFDLLVRRHQKGVWRIVRRYVRSEADAFDVTQQVFVRAFRGLASFRGASSVRAATAVLLECERANAHGARGGSVKHWPDRSVQPHGT